MEKPSKCKKCVTIVIIVILLVGGAIAGLAAGLSLLAK